MADRKLLLKGGIREPLSPLSNECASTRTPRRVKHRVATPSKTPGSHRKLATENSGYDRYIANRTNMDTQLAHHKLMESDQKNENNVEDDEYAEKMAQNLQGDINKLSGRILQMKIKPPTSKGEVHMKMLYSNSKPTPAKFKSVRHIPSTADKILDAPFILDNYYLNLLDWGNCGLIAIPLSDKVFLWNSSTGSVEDLFGDTHSTDEGIDITSVKWIQDGVHLAVGLSNGNVELWDCAENKRVRNMQGHTSRVGSLDWNAHILTSGAKSGLIFNHDVRVADHHISSFLHHTREICVLKWSPDGKLLASGANDNLLNIWDYENMSANLNTDGVNEATNPLHSLCEHLSAVKAASWCPWQRNVIISGGGTCDRSIKLWNASSGVYLQSHNVMSQVSGVMWSEAYKEIICSHGNDLTIFKYPKMTREVDLKGHTSRILSIAMSPNGHHVASVGADETLRVWKCFEPDQKQSKSSKKSSISRNFALR